MTASLSKKIKITFYLTESIASQLRRQTVEKITIKSKTHTKPINTLFGNNVEFLNINLLNAELNSICLCWHYYEFTISFTLAG
jgi:hypothetical protein